MINELKNLADSMEKCGIKTEESWHKSFLPLKTTSPCYVVHLSDAGQIADIRLIDKQQVLYLKTYLGGSNGDTFPAFNFTPFYTFSDQLPKKASKESKSKLCDDLIAALKNQKDPEIPEILKLDRRKADAKTEKCIDKIAKKFFDCMGPNGDFPVLSKLMKSLRLLLDSDGKQVSFAEQFNRKLIDFLLADPRLGNYSNYKSSLFPILFKCESDVILFFDVEIPEPEYVASNKTMREVNLRLFAADDKAAPKNAGTEASFQDAFGLECNPEDLKDKMPSVKLPGKLSDTVLRSMNSESPCQYRYGKIDAESYPAGKIIKQHLKNTLEWICKPEFEGKTWESAGFNEIIFAYPTELKIEKNMWLARSFGNGHGQEMKFLDCAHDTLRQLSGLDRDLKNIKIELFAIKVADRARRKIVYSRDYSADLLQTSVEQWKRGAENIPDIRLQCWLPRGKDDPKTEKSQYQALSFHAPYPLAVMPVIYFGWHQNSQSKTIPKFKGNPVLDNIPVFEGLDLFFDAGIREDQGKSWLSKIIIIGYNLLVSAGEAAIRGEIISSGQIPEYLEKALPILGILLYKLNIRKESYMNESPYLIGRMLNLTDRLHALYCEVVRKGNLPNELLGDSFYPQFTMNPVQAFAALGERIRPYLAWAKTASGEKAGLARWLLAEIGKTANALKANSLPKRMTDADKAQMLLGFLGNISSQDGEKVSAEEKQD